jgi:hypothetical protein
MMIGCATSTGLPERDERVRVIAASSDERPGQGRGDLGATSPDRGAGAATGHDQAAVPPQRPGVPSVVFELDSSASCWPHRPGTRPGCGRPRAALPAKAPDAKTRRHEVPGGQRDDHRLIRNCRSEAMDVVLAPHRLNVAHCRPMLAPAWLLSPWQGVTRAEATVNAGPEVTSSFPPRRSACSRTCVDGAAPDWRMGGLRPVDTQAAVTYALAPTLASHVPAPHAGD